MKLIQCLFWIKCDPPKWVYEIKEKKLHGDRLYDRVMYLKGKYFKYKIVSNDWGQGWSNDIYYRKLRWKHLM
jgi:hypothetical protein